MFTTITGSQILLIHIENDQWINPNKLVHICKNGFGSKLFFDHGEALLSPKSCSEIIEILHESFTRNKEVGDQ